MRQGRLVRDANGIALGGQVCVRVPRGRRKLEKFEREIGRPIQYLYSFMFEGNFAYITGAEFERVKSLVTKARVDFSLLLECWSGTDARSAGQS